MKIKLLKLQDSPRFQSADSMLEIMVGVGLLGMVLASLFSGISMATGMTEMARQDLRATQILLERIEGLRLFNWNQLLYSNSLCPANFTSSFYPIPNSSGSTGITYYGTIVLTNVAAGPACSYSNQIRAIVVTVNWTNGGLGHTRSLTTCQSQYGAQNYAFNH